MTHRRRWQTLLPSLATPRSGWLWMSVCRNDLENIAKSFQVDHEKSISWWKNLHKCPRPIVLLSGAFHCHVRHWFDNCYSTRTIATTTMIQIALDWMLKCPFLETWLDKSLGWTRLCLNFCHCLNWLFSRRNKLSLDDIFSFFSGLSMMFAHFTSTQVNRNDCSNPFTLSHFCLRRSPVVDWKSK